MKTSPEEIDELAESCAASFYAVLPKEVLGYELGTGIKHWRQQGNIVMLQYYSPFIDGVQIERLGFKKHDDDRRSHYEKKIDGAFAYMKVMEVFIPSVILWTVRRKSTVEEIWNDDIIAGD